MTTAAQHRHYQRALMAGPSYVAIVWSGEAEESGRRARKLGAEGPVFGGNSIIADGEGFRREVAIAPFRAELENSLPRK